MTVVGDNSGVKSRVVYISIYICSCSNVRDKVFNHLYRPTLFDKVSIIVTFNKNYLH